MYSGESDREPLKFWELLLILVAIPTFKFYAWFRTTTFAYFFTPWLPPLPDDLGGDE